MFIVTHKLTHLFVKLMKSEYKNLIIHWSARLLELCARNGRQDWALGSLHPTPFSIFNAQNDALIPNIQLFQEDKSQNCMRAHSSVVGSKSFPQGQETFATDYTGNNVHGAFVLGLPVNNFHILQPVKQGG